jgi:hypothetical protein
VVGVLAPVGCRGFSGGGPPGGVPVVVAAIGFAGGDDKFKLRITNDRGTDLTLVKMTCGCQLANSSRMCCAGLRPRSFGAFSCLQLQLDLDSSDGVCCFFNYVISLMTMLYFEYARGRTFCGRILPWKLLRVQGVTLAEIA